MEQLETFAPIGLMIVTLFGLYLSRRRSQMQKQAAKAQMTTTPDQFQDPLHHSSWKVRLQALEETIHDNPPNLLDILLEMLSDSALDVRQLASEKLVDFEDEAISGLSDILKNGDLSTREVAIQTIASMQTRARIPLLVYALEHDESAWIRTPVAQALGAISGEAVTQVLINAKDDTHPEVRQAVRQALETIGTPKALKAIQ